MIDGINGCMKIMHACMKGTTSQKARMAKHQSDLAADSTALEIGELKGTIS